MKSSKTCQTCHRQYFTDADFLRFTSRWRLCSAQNLWFNCDCGSTLFLAKGNYTWYSPNAGLSNEAASLFDILGSKKKLPHIKSRIFSIQDQLKQTDVDLKNVSAELKHEPILAANILGIAERLSGYDPRPAGDLHDKLTHAILHIGAKRLDELLVVAFLKSIKIETLDFNSEDFWRNAQVCANIAEELSPRLIPDGDPGDAFLAGFLCNIGKIVMAYYNPKETDSILNLVRNPKTPQTWQKAEEQHQLDSHVVIGEIAAAFWGFPQFVANSIQFHHVVRRGTNRASTFYNLVALANQMSHWVLSRPERIDQSFLEEVSHKLNLSESDLENLAETFIKNKLSAS